MYVINYQNILIAPLVIRVRNWYFRPLFTKFLVSKINIRELDFHGIKLVREALWIFSFS